MKGEAKREEQKHRRRRTHQQWGRDEESGRDGGIRWHTCVFALSNNPYKKQGLIWKLLWDGWSIQAKKESRERQETFQFLSAYLKKHVCSMLKDSLEIKVFLCEFIHLFRKYQIIWHSVSQLRWQNIILNINFNSLLWLNTNHFLGNGMFIICMLKKVILSSQASFKNTNLPVVRHIAHLPHHCHLSSRLLVHNTFHIKNKVYLSVAVCMVCHINTHIINKHLR